MQITLEQLKEIAKAGFQGWHTDFVYNNSEYSYDEENNRYVMSWVNNPVFILWISKDSEYVWFDSFRSPFNALAAIRKMEEIGLIEK